MDDPPQRHTNIPRLHNPYELDTSLDEVEEREAIPGDRYHDSKLQQLREELPQKHHWVLTANGKEEEFGRLLGQFFAQQRKAKKKGSHPDLSPLLEAVGWRHAVLNQIRAAERKAARERDPSPEYSLPGAKSWVSYPPAVRKLLDEWQLNPRATPPWVRQGSDGVFDSIDLDITAWEHIARPTNKSDRKAFRSLLVEMATQFGGLSSIIQWDSVPQSNSAWICSRSSKEFNWAPDCTTEELLRWITSTWKMGLEDVRDGLVPYFLRSKQRDVWHNQMGQVAHRRPARSGSKRKVVVLRMLKGPTLTPEQLRLRALIINDEPIPHGLAQVGLPSTVTQPTSGLAPGPSKLSAQGPLHTLDEMDTSHQGDDELTRQIHDAVEDISSSQAGPSSQPRLAPGSRAPMDLDSPESL